MPGIVEVSYRFFCREVTRKLGNCTEFLLQNILFQCQLQLCQVSVQSHFWSEFLSKLEMSQVQVTQNVLVCGCDLFWEIMKHALPSEVYIPHIHAPFFLVWDLICCLNCICRFAIFSTRTSHLVSLSSITRHSQPFLGKLYTTIGTCLCSTYFLHLYQSLRQVCLSKTSLHESAYRYCMFNYVSHVFSTCLCIILEKLALALLFQNQISLFYLET